MAKRSEPISPSGLYTEEMRQRALNRIAERNRQFDQELLLREYMEVMFRAFRRRLARQSVQRSEGSVDGRSTSDDAEPNTRRLARGPRRRKGESDEAFAARRAAYFNSKPSTSD
jgi:hypothetical protein